MAQRVKVLLVDDLEGGEAAETVSFALDGMPYEIDLSAGNAQKLRESLQPFIGKARKAGGPRRSRTSTVPSRERSANIRAWAKDRGIPVNDRGRIAMTVVEQYEAAH